MPSKPERIRLVFYANCLGRGGAHQTQLAWFDLLQSVDDFELKIFCAAEGWFSEQLRRRGLAYEILPMPRALGLIKHGSWNNRLKTAFRVLAMTGGLLRAWSRVAFRSADIVVLTGGRDFLVLLPLVLRRHRHTVTVPQTTDWGQIPSCKLMCQVAAKVYAISDTVAESIVEMGIAPQKVAVYPLIYTTDYEGRFPAKDEIRRQLGLPANVVILGIAGVIRPQKGQREAILVLEQVIQRRPDVRLIIAGNAPSDSPAAVDYERELRELVATRGLQDKVIVLGWRDDIPRVMHAMDVLLVPSHNNEGVPRVILEGLEAGLPIVATDMPQFREIIGRLNAGFLQAIDRIHDWAETIVQLLENPAKLAAASRQARTVWATRYSRESVRPKIESAFREIAPAKAIKNNGAIAGTPRGLKSPMAAESLCRPDGAAAQPSPKSGEILVSSSVPPP